MDKIQEAELKGAFEKNMGILCEQFRERGMESYDILGGVLQFAIDLYLRAGIERTIKGGK